MNFTKQDILVLQLRLSSVAAKDSQFKEAKTLSDKTFVPVLDNAENKKVSWKTFTDNVASGIDLSKIPFPVGNGKVSTVRAILADLIARVTGEHLGVVINAGNVGYGGDYVLYGGGYYEKVSDALDYILDVLYGLSSFPATATRSDIINVFNQ